MSLITFSVIQDNYSLHCFLSTLVSCNVQLFLSLYQITLTFLMSPGHLFCRLSLKFGFLTFPHNWINVLPFWQEHSISDGVFSVLYIKKYKMFNYVIVNDAKFYQLVKFIFTWLPFCKDSISLFLLFVGNS